MHELRASNSNKYYFICHIGISYRQSRLTITITQNEVRVSIDPARDFHILIDGREQAANETTCMYSDCFYVLNIQVLCCDWHFLLYECAICRHDAFISILLRHSFVRLISISVVFNQYQILTLKPIPDTFLSACDLPADTIDPYNIPQSNEPIDEEDDEHNILYWRRVFKQLNANNWK